jgi:hypothetical protein
MAAQAESSTTVLETAIDWITVTTRSNRARDRWLLHCLKLQKREVADGNRVRPFHVNGYLGQQCGRIRFGETDSAMLVQLSGELADQQFGYLWSDHDTCTRLDIAVTVRYSVGASSIPLEAFACASHERESRPRLAQALIIRDNSGGSTCYVGSRRSSKFFRIYNKEAECRSRKDWPGIARYASAIRYELELHDVAAVAVGGWLNETGAAHPKIRAYLRHHLETHGIPCPWSNTDAETLPSGFRRRSDRETRLDWLRTSVRPAVDWLKSSCTVEEIRDILDLGG